PLMGHTKMLANCSATQDSRHLSSKSERNPINATNPAEKPHQVPGKKKYVHPMLAILKSLKKGKPPKTSTDRKRQVEIQEQHRKRRMRRKESEKWVKEIRSKSFASKK